MTPLLKWLQVVKVINAAKMIQLKAFISAFKVLWTFIPAAGICSHEIAGLIPHQDEKLTIHNH